MGAYGSNLLTTSIQAIKITVILNASSMAIGQSSEVSTMDMNMQIPEESTGDINCHHLPILQTLQNAQTSYNSYVKMIFAFLININLFTYSWLSANNVIKLQLSISSRTCLSDINIIH